MTIFVNYIILNKKGKHFLLAGKVSSISFGGSCSLSDKQNTRVNAEIAGKGGSGQELKRN